MNDYLALTYSNLRLAELRADADRERLVQAARSPRARRDRTVSRLGVRVRRPAAPAHVPTPCCA